MKLISGLMLLACVPLALAKGSEDYPKEKVAEYVVEKVSVKALPSEVRPKLEKGKQTLAEYGYTTSKVDDQQAILDAPNGNSRITISILQENKSGIYVCLSGGAQNPSVGPIQRVLLLKRKNPDSLLAGRESAKSFASCPVIGGADQDVSSSSD